MEKLFCEATSLHFVKMRKRKESFSARIHMLIEKKRKRLNNRHVSVVSQQIRVLFGSSSICAVSRRVAKRKRGTRERWREEGVEG